LGYEGQYEVFSILNDKSRLTSLASELDIPVPTVFRDISSATPPFVVKPRDQSSAKGVYYAKNQKQAEKLERKFKDVNGLIIQQYIKGKAVGYSVFAKDGQILIGCGHRRLAEYPVTGGSSVYRENYDNKQMSEAAEKIVAATQWSGFAMFEFKLTEQNELYLLEVNPRIWGSINQGLQNDCNYFEFLFGPITAKKASPRKHTRTFISPLVYLSFIKYCFKLNFKPIFLFLKNLPSNKADVNIFDDPGGWASLVLRKLF